MPYTASAKACIASLEDTMTQVVMLRPNTWTAIWNGQTSPISFNSKGAALAYLATCDRAGKLRA